MDECAQAPRDAGPIKSSSTALVDIVLPCLDEAGALPWVLARLPEGSRAIVVDNGSSDDSVPVARSLGATVIECAQRGYGAACHAGLVAARAELVAFCDCDASVDPATVSQAVEFILTGQADLVVGRRRPISRGAWPAHARIANYVLSQQIRRRTGTTLRDLGPLRVARREALLALNVDDRRSGYPLETVLKAAAAGWTIRSLDVDYRPRVGQSKVTGTLRGTVRAVRDMRAVFAQ